MYSALARIIYPVYTTGVQEIRDISEVFSLWASTKVMAEEIGELPDTVNRWRQRGRIPEDALTKVVRHAQPKTLAMLSVEVLLRLNVPMRKRGRPRKAAA
jgi:hypothetical protein